MNRHVKILATGSHVPERVVTNAEVDALLGESTNEWLLANVGIRERRWMSSRGDHLRPDHRSLPKSPATRRYPG